MIHEMKPLCLIPARGGSKRLPGKNIRLLAGKPLIAYTIEAARASGVFDCVCVSTDDEEIASVALEYGAEIPFMRPAHLADDTAGLLLVVRHALEFFSERGQDYDSFCVLQPTSPLRTATDISNAYALFRSNDAYCVVGVTACEHPPFWSFEKRDQFMLPYWGPEYLLKRTQDLPELWRPIGAMFIARASAYLEEGTFYTDRTIGYEMPLERAVDVDNAFDLYLAECLLERPFRDTESSIPDSTRHSG